MAGPFGAALATQITPQIHYLKLLNSRYAHPSGDNYPPACFIALQMDHHTMTSPLSAPLASLRRRAMSRVVVSATNASPPRAIPHPSPQQGHRRMSRMTRFLAALGLWCSFSTGSSAQAPDRVVIGLAIPLTVTDGGTYAIAEELGLFQAENIVVQHVVLPGAGAILPQVLQRQVTFGFPLTETLLSAHQPGQAPLPVAYVYNAGPSNTLEIAVRTESPIRTLADLRGRGIGVGALTWGTIPQTRALLRSVGLEPGRDVQIVAVGVLGAGFHALREDRVQALNFNSTWIDLLELEGTPARRLEFPPVFRRMVTNGFLAHRSTIEGNPGLIERFGRAYAAATVACDANPRACVEAFWRRNAAARPSSGQEQALADNIRIVQRHFDRTLRDDSGALRIQGRYDLDIIRDYVREMHRWREFPTADIPVERYFTNAFVEGFNRFDRAALVARARALP
ncbi:ABC transporter substrate-binding protein [Sabulicella rubraurantiaca]|uniref:ABC transporter substrate-binding protein n=1 Tax=Sabulicella rubraurantiaca TaxID=2811429 RepID=UPI001A97BD36|nr:ABC transporter substrate-binding protein [Sabulicella rubraurantiaca]